MLLATDCSSLASPDWRVSATYPARSMARSRILRYPRGKPRSPGPCAAFGKDLVKEPKDLAPHGSGALARRVSSGAR